MLVDDVDLYKVLSKQNNTYKDWKFKHWMTIILLLLIGDFLNTAICVYVSLPPPSAARNVSVDLPPARRDPSTVTSFFCSFGRV